MKVLCVHSFSVHGTASLKAVLSILGTQVLPVPSLYLSGLTNIPGYVKFPPPFRDLFYSSLELARSRQERLLVYIGYLGAAEQAEIIAEGIDAYRDIIDYILVDPVSGDRGRIYVPEDVLDAWPDLLKKADWAFPNFTELQLLSGRGIEKGKGFSTYLDGFKERFPDLAFVVTSLPGKDELSLGLFHEKQQHFFQHMKVDAHYGGTGDVFVSYFIRYAFFEKKDFAVAMEKAALKTLAVIKYALEKKSVDLILYPAV